MQRNGEDTEGVIWTTSALPLGATGLDLRRADAPGTLTELLNARFQDERTVERRLGHTGRLVQDGSGFAEDKRTTSTWIYGHGTQIAVNGNDGYTGATHPIHNRGGGTFRLGDTDVVWTGDRLLLAKEDGAFHGSHAHWARSDADPLPHGLPAYLPVQTDSFPPVTISGSYLETCLTETLRVVAHTVTADERIRAYIIDRETGAVLDSSLADDDDGVCLNLRVINSGGVPCILYVNDGGLQITNWNGTEWATPTVIEAAAVMFDVCVVPTGFHVVWRVSDEIFVGRFVGASSTDLPYEFGVEAFVGDSTPNGPVAIAVGPAGTILLVWESSGAVEPAGLYCLAFDEALSVEVDTLCQLSSSTGWTKGVTACFRGLTNSVGRTPFVIHAARGTITHSWELRQPAPGVVAGLTLLQSEDVYNALPTSKSFRVGDEVFIWLHAQNSDTNFLCAGVTKPQVCGTADPETAEDQPTSSSFTWLNNVTPDPLHPDGTRLTWLRSYNAGVYFRAGNSKIGDLNFLPELSAVQFGHSMYLAGSMARNFDGVELGDVGFHDFPVIVGTPSAANGAGSLTASGTYRIRIYAVRYNKAGERFQSIAVTSTLAALTGAQDTITLTIASTPVTNHDDVVYEVYRTEDGGTTYYIEGTVANNRNAASVTFDLALSDAALILRPGDPHETGVGGVDELEESAPLGCEVFAVAGDRLWAIGGQIPAGVAQFSKLYEPNEGAGFDALAGTQVIDATGGRLTSIAGFGDAAVVVFQEDRLYAMTGGGPDNYGQGSFGVPELVVSDGATNHAGTAVIPLGIVFWGAGGPRILGTNFRVENISEPVGPLSATMTPTGVRVDLARREVVWFTAEGDALLWSYSAGSRWARWDGLPVAGCSPHLLVTTDGRLLEPSAVTTDDGRRFEFAFATGNVRPEQLLSGSTLLRRCGLVGKHNGPHRVRFRIYYNGSPLWSERYRWEPEEGTYLTEASEWEDLTPAGIDALSITERAGTYATHKRVVRQTCRFFRIHVSDCGDDGFTPWELSFELGVKPGPGRVVINTFGE